MARTPQNRNQPSPQAARALHDLVEHGHLCNALTPFLVNARRPVAKSIALETTDASAALPAMCALFGGDADGVVEIGLGVTKARVDGLVVEGRVESTSKTAAKARGLDLLGAAGAPRVNQYEGPNGHTGKSSTAVEVRDDHEQPLQIQNSNPCLVAIRKLP